MDAMYTRSNLQSMVWSKKKLITEGYRSLPAQQSIAETGRLSPHYLLRGPRDTPRGIEHFAPSSINSGHIILGLPSARRWMSQFLFL